MKLQCQNEKLKSQGSTRNEVDLPEELKFCRSTRKRDVKEKGLKRNKQGKIKCKRKRDVKEKRCKRKVGWT